MSASSKKFDFQRILNNIKLMISPEGVAINPDPDDAIGMKVAELNVLTQRLIKVHEEQAEELAKINLLLSGLFRDIETLRNPLESEKDVRIEVESETKEAKEEEK